MPIFYKGIGPGTHWHANDLRISGLTPRMPGTPPGYAALLAHVRHGTTNSPYISLTRSYGIAKFYALTGRAMATPANPGYVYEIVLHDPLPGNMKLYDPVVEVANFNANIVTNHSYHHDGDPNFLLGVVDPISMASHLQGFASLPPGSAAISRPPNLSNDLETLVRAVRDAEIVVSGNIPANCFSIRHPVH